MAGHTANTKQLAGCKVVDAKKGKRIGKVHRFVFHPSERRVVGFTVKRPDAALMFHRKDMFVALGGYDVEEGLVVVRDDERVRDQKAVRALGLDWDSCVIWVGMPAMTASGEFLGFIESVSFNDETGAVESITTENGVANDVILGKRRIPGKLVRGFRRGQGMALAAMGQYSGEEADEAAETGAILVADEAAAIETARGAAAAAGKATAVVTDKAKKGVTAVKAKADEGMEKARPTVRRVAKKTEGAVEAGAFAAGRQIGRASGMFAAFKEEFDKASRGEDDG